MKRTVYFFSVLVAIFLLTLSAYAADSSADGYIFSDSAPVAAAKFASATAKDANTYGTISLEIADTSVFAGLTEYCTFDADEGIVRNRYTVPSTIFDVVLKYKLKGTVAGYTLFAFYNPERILPLLTEDATVYEAIYENDGDMGYIVADDPKVGRDTMTDSKAVYMEYLKYLGADQEKAEYYLDAYNNSVKDGSVVTVYSSGSNLTTMSLPSGSEIARWVFTETNTSDNNWYRTKLYLDYVDGEVANTTAPRYPAVSAPVYYYNPGYAGPTFDIVGAMKKEDDSGLRFGSVYFTAANTLNANNENAAYFDNSAEIVETGVVCYPSELLGENVLTLKTDGALRIPATGYMTYDQENGEMIYTGVLTGIEEAPDMYITAKSYIIYKDKETGEEITVYSDPIARCFNDADDAEMK